MEKRILTALRVKPSDFGQSAISSITGNKINLDYRGSTLSVKVDQVFDDAASQGDVFKYIATLIEDVFLKSISCSVMAYGHTGSGKTYTMYGAYWSKKLQARKNKTRQNNFFGWQENIDAPDFEETLGVIPRTVEHIFKRFEGSINDEKSSRKRSNQISVKFYQIYNEKVLDLLSVV